MDLKQELFDFCKSYSSARINRIQDQITEVQKALSSETKSSAGDKHETGRAMLQLEREKLGQQLAVAEQMQQVLVKVPLSKTVICSLGSLVYTTANVYFIAISAGEYKQTNRSIFCISAATPISQLLLGKGLDDTFSFQGKQHRITKIL